MISIYAAVNLLMGGIWVVFMPSYIALVKCDKREDCDPSFWMSAGQLIQDIWYPGTVRIAGYGAKAANRYMPNSNQNVLRPACIPCPGTFTTDTGGPFSGIGPMQSDRVSGGALTTVVDKSTKLKCVRVPGLTMDPDRTIKLKGARGDPVSAKEYVWTQLFGKEWQAVHDLLLGTANQTGNVDLYALQHKWKGKYQIPYNEQLFKNGSPFPWLRMALVRLYKYEAADPANGGGGTKTVYRDAPVDYKLDGYYVVNGVPFVPPKLWHFWKRPRKNANKSSSDWSVWYDPVQPTEYKELDKVVSSQPLVVMKLPSMCSPSNDMIKYCDRSDWGWYKHPDAGGTKELEWWYPGLPYTSIFAWEEKHYMDYIERFFAGGHVTTCYWVPL